MPKPKTFYNSLLDSPKNKLSNSKARDAKARNKILCFGDTFLSVSWQTLRPVLPKQEIRFWRRRKMVFS